LRSDRKPTKRSVGSKPDATAPVTLHGNLVVCDVPHIAAAGRMCMIQPGK
jgi:hypothetical protein